MQTESIVKVCVGVVAIGQSVATLYLQWRRGKPVTALAQMPWILAGITVMMPVIASDLTTPFVAASLVAFAIRLLGERLTASR
jgi:hypothetical protein